MIAVYASGMELKLARLVLEAETWNVCTEASTAAVKHKRGCISSSENKFSGRQRQLLGGATRAVAPGGKRSGGDRGSPSHRYLA